MTTLKHPPVIGYTPGQTVTRTTRTGGKTPAQTLWEGVVTELLTTRVRVRWTVKNGRTVGARVSDHLPAELDGVTEQALPKKPRLRAVLAGHTKTIEYLAPREKFANTPPEGVRALCKCGWAGEVQATLRAASETYSDHLAAERDSGERICSACGQRKSISHMAKASTHLCRDCLTQKTKRWAEANPEQFDRARRNSHLLKSFGLTVDEWQALFVSQGRVCAICKAPSTDPRGYAMHTDHDHETGAVRGILCQGCNNGLGHFRDRPELLDAAAAYLRRLPDDVAAVLAGVSS